MPSRGRSIDTGPLASVLKQDYVLVPKGRRVEQIAVLTIDPDAIRKLALKVGADGDYWRLNTEGQVFNLDGEDRTAGVWIRFVGLPGQIIPVAPSGIVEFAFSYGDGV
jgi:hypothetical protein